MATNKLFIKILVKDDRIICINPSQLLSFDIGKNIKLRTKKAGVVGTPKNEDDIEMHTADVIRLYSAQGTGMTYEVGKDISAQDFDYIVAALSEWIYLIRPEFKALEEQRAKEAMAAFEKDTANPTET
jgi:hypothetical protein